MSEAIDPASARAHRLASLPFRTAGPSGSFVSGTVDSWRDIASQWELLGLLTRRELKARYKDSAGGFLWSLSRPLTQLFIYYVVIGQFLGAARSIDNFAVYVFAGITIYTLFSEIVGACTASIVNNAGLVKKVYLPREIFPLATVGSALFNFLIQFAILFVAALLLGQMAFGFNLVYGLAGLGLVLIYGVALGLLLAAANVYLRDIQYLVEVVLMLLMWGSPIVYHWTSVRGMMPPWLVELYLNNPVTLAVLGFQEAFWSPVNGGEMPAALFTRMVVAGLVGLVLLWFCQRVFARLEGNFAQEL
jgi:ABC-2 type transport system permease protein